MFTLFPALDLRSGRVVRLVQGRAENEIVYSDDPAEMARHWTGQGAAWLHVVNLDGAFGDADTQNTAALANILAAVKAPVQFGGGVRTLESMRRAFGLGVTRIVLGTLAVENPDIVAQALQEFGAERIIVAVESRDGIIASRGWVASSGRDAVEFGRQMRALGLIRALVTDIARDGMLQGIDTRAMANYAQATGLQIIAAGGVATLEDIDNLVAVSDQGVEGVNIGQALYTNAFTLKQALARVAAVESTLDAAPRTRKPRYCEG
ncbi:MAG: 1-(5-phosphoribosyl)-5-[(5-phosphoribosylamino)methylideneamino]imidazole-4-carboxamide isomerase [Anaerolineae bacterium]|nr:1-(5-phosphoribosyl)-5-[(5-phosphoribosylamino)methylideneamino]imidazole-4-carboxamide isomerase [Anaerolineae bacterium]